MTQDELKQKVAAAALDYKKHAKTGSPAPRQRKPDHSAHKTRKPGTS